jgi:uncharacterized membrane protein
MSKPAPRSQSLKGVCQICGETKPLSALVPAELVRPSLVETISKRFPGWNPDGHICLADLSKYRKEYLKEQLADEAGELSTLDEEVIESLHQRELLSSNIGAEFDQQFTFGERLADRIAAFGGSWTFILWFGGVLAFWILLNAVLLASRPFDPYPFILLNLVLSSLAALQAPVIMMSQNRGEARDRMRAENDYKVNLKAELEIRHLHEKMDHLLRRQWNRLFEIQQIQIELLEELNTGKEKRA